MCAQSGGSCDLGVPVRKVARAIRLRLRDMEGLVLNMCQPYLRVRVAVKGTIYGSVTCLLTSFSTETAAAQNAAYSADIVANDERDFKQ